MKLNSIFGYFKQLNHFLNFLFEYNYITMFKINRDVKPKPEIVEKIVFDSDDLALIFYMLSRLKKNVNFQNTLTILYYTGIRASDILSLNIEDVDIKNHTLKYFSPKKKVFRQIAFHSELVPIFESIKKLKETGKVIEFQNVESLQQAIKNYFYMLELKEKRYSSRTFRKTFITLARKKGMDETTVKELVGHSHTSVTDKFYNRIDFDQMKKELNKYLLLSELPYKSIKQRAEELLNKKKR